MNEELRKRTGCRLRHRIAVIDGIEIFRRYDMLEKTHTVLACTIAEPAVYAQRRHPHPTSDADREWCLAKVKQLIQTGMPGSSPNPTEGPPCSNSPSPTAICSPN